MHRTFFVPRRFHPVYSLLGRGIRRLVGDERHAEALYILVLSGLALGLLLAQYLAWAFLKPAILAAPTGPVAVALWLTQLGGVVGCGLTCVLGFKPAVTVLVTPNALHMRQGSRTLTLAYEDIRAADPLSALRFHRHYARYAATHVFANRMRADLLLLDTAHGPVVVGLTLDDQAALLHLLDAQLMPSFVMPVARVA